MTITFFSNFLNDHQLPFCEEIISHIGIENFHFVATTPMDSDRVEMGFENMNITKKFVIRDYENNTNHEFATKLMLESDIVIIGSAANLPYDKRINSGKITFRYNERILKKSILHLFDPRLFRSIYNQFTKYRKANLFTLCASAYTSHDLTLFGFPKEKCYKWGYFPKVKEYEDIDNLLLQKEKLSISSKTISILWVGRLIKWKHPEYAIYVAKKLAHDNVNFKMTIIGSGYKFPQLKKLIKKYHLDNNVQMLGNLPPQDVRNYMERSQIFLFTSDKGEGWGAVLNESMNSGCAVIANHEIGSVPFIIKHRINGLVFSTRHELYSNVKFLIENPKEIKKLGKEAYMSMINMWNARNATNRFFNLIESIKNKQTTTYIDGPCSLA